MKLVSDHCSIKLSEQGAIKNCSNRDNPITGKYSSWLSKPRNN